MKTFSTAALVAVLLVTACSRDEKKPGAAEPAPAPAALAKPEMVPVGQRRIVELEGGIRVEVLAEGQGEVVAPGDHVALSMTLSYVPVAAPAATGAEPAGEKADAKPDAAAATEKPAETPANVEGVVVLEGVVAAAAQAEPSKPEPAPVETPAGTEPVAPAVTKPVASTGTEPVAPTGTEPVAPTGTEPVAPTSTEPAVAASAEPAAAAGAESAAATEGGAVTAEPPGAPPEPTLAPPLEPVVLMSTKSAGTPLRVVVGKSGALLPGLSRALIGLRQGSIVEITLSPEAAYGAAGLPSAGVPPGTPLFATVEIREVKR